MTKGAFGGECQIKESKNGLKFIEIEGGYEQRKTTQRIHLLENKPVLMENIFEEMLKKNEPFPIMLEADGGNYLLDSKDGARQIIGKEMSSNIVYPVQEGQRL